MTTMIRLIISPKGQTLLETKGFSGAGCREASEFLEHALGHTIQERLTSEFHQPAQTGQPLHESMAG
jgi:hypothetical protein